MSLSGGPATSVVSAPRVFPPLAVGNDQLFYLSTSAANGHYTALNVMMAPTSGSSTVLYSEGFINGSGMTALAADDNTIYWGAVGEARGIAVDKTSVYWTTGTALMKVTPKSTGDLH